jgi:GNAT superfamily N-acetyltransferase
MPLEIRKLQKEDIKKISSAFQEIGWNKPPEQYRKYLAEQKQNRKLVLVAFKDEKFVGYVTIVWQSDYPFFKENDIPEIVDLNVLPKYQRQGIGTKLMNKAEGLVAKRTDKVGIGVGLAPGYNAAQRMYVLRGYVPDGHGITYQEEYIEFGQEIKVDHSLNIHFTKKLN